MRKIDPWLLVIVAIHAGVQLAFASFVPIYDGWKYAECVMDAAVTFSPSALNCFGHPSIAYTGLLALPQFLFPGSAVAFGLVATLLGAVAVVAVHGILVRVLGPTRRTEILLATACFAACPIVNANLTNPSPDAGVLVFFVLFLWALVSEHRRSALLCGVALVFSKESGAVLYLLSLVLWLALVEDRTGRSLRKLAVWSVPIFLLGGWYSARYLGGAPALWSDPRGLAVGQSLTLDVTKTYFRGFLVALFVIHFTWVASILVVAGAVLRFRQWRNERLELFFFALLVSAVFFLTRYETYAHPRYVLAIYPLLVIVFAVATVRLFSSRRLQLTLGLFALLWALSNFRTADPLSQSLYGTFPFGDHAMLKMTSIAQQRYGYGLDGLVYNFEFTHLDDLQSVLYAQVAPTPDTVLAVDYETNYQLAPRLDSRTFERTLRHTGSFEPLWMSVQDIEKLNGHLRDLWFVEIPTADTRASMAWLKANYILAEERVAERSGYRLRALHFVAP